jgi:2'-5' RNA ligase
VPSALLRLFFGLPVPGDALEALERWQREALVHRAVRLVPAENLHVTLVFLGMRPQEEIASLTAVLQETVRGLPRPTLEPVQYRETDHVGMLVLDDEDGRAGEIQGRLSASLESLGVYQPERRPWLAHLTVARFRRRPRLHPALPALSPLVPAEVVLYSSALGPDGARYEVEAAAELAQTGA